MQLQGWPINLINDWNDRPNNLMSSKMFENGENFSNLSENFSVKSLILSLNEIRKFIKSLFEIKLRQKKVTAILVTQ